MNESNISIGDARILPVQFDEDVSNCVKLLAMVFPHAITQCQIAHLIDHKRLLAKRGQLKE